MAFTIPNYMSIGRQMQYHGSTMEKSKRNRLYLNLGMIKEKSVLLLIYGRKMTVWSLCEMIHDCIWPNSSKLP